MKSVFTASIAAYSLFFAALPVDAGEVSVKVRFSTDEASIIRDYFRQQPVNQHSRHRSLLLYSIASYP